MPLNRSSNPLGHRTFTEFFPARHRLIRLFHAQTLIRGQFT
jgi:hypothetical protein